MDEYMSVREWQRQFTSGAFNSRDTGAQIAAGWWDWFCKDESLAGRLKRIAPVVLGITESAILDHYRVAFKNNCPLDGPLYDDVRFYSLDEERDDRYFTVVLDCPYEDQKWVMYSERHDPTFRNPEFACGNVAQMCRHINSVARELADGLPDEPAQEKSVRPPVKMAARKRKGAER